ncbi:MAG: hypothetical protein OXG35_16950 [Acidobacteria bacterium]|nr:hypothetical protein [Acidobacteriota bacterium]
MNGETEVARLRIEIRTKTRLVLRVVELTTRTTLPTTAKIIRRARGWHANQAFKFAVGDTVWTSTRSRTSGNERPAKNRQFAEIVQKGRSIEFTHDIGRKRKLTVLIEDIHLSTKPETAYPRMTDAVGTLAVHDLTPDDSYYWIVEERDDPTSFRQSSAIELCNDEEQRAELDCLYRAVDIDEIRLSRRGPLRSHQPGSRRHGPGPGLPREPETAPGHELRVGTQDHQPVRLKLRPDDRPPTVKIVEGRARLEDPPETADARGDAWSAVEDAADQPENVGRYLKEAEELARRAPADLAVTCAYGQILEDRHRHEEARDVYQHTVDLGTRALPENFRGVVDGTSEQGRGLLTALAGLANYEAERGSRQRAVELLETLVLWDEDPRNHGQLRLGSEYLRAGRLDQALPILEANRRDYPPLEYDLGMLHIIRHEWAPAAAGILRGVAENQYVAEIALGATKLNPIAGHDRGFGRNREAARWHMARYGQVWREDKGARAFLRWVSTHPEALKTLASVRAIEQRLADESRFGVQDQLNELLAKTVDEVDETVGCRIVARSVRPSSAHALPWKTLEDTDESERWW